jgi:hypothetical protein
MKRQVSNPLPLLKDTEIVAGQCYIIQKNSRPLHGRTQKEHQKVDEWARRLGNRVPVMTQELERRFGVKSLKPRLTEMVADLSSASGIHVSRIVKRQIQGLICWLCEHFPGIITDGIPVPPATEAPNSEPSFAVSSESANLEAWSDDGEFDWYGLYE